MENTQGFTCFVINLDKDTERYDHIRDLLEKGSISFSRVPATDGRKLTDSEIAVIYDREKTISKNGTPLSRAEIGCSASHLGIYKKMVSENIEYGLILEDDITIPNNFKQIVQAEIQKRSPFAWEYLSFDYAAYGYNFLKIWIPGMLRIYRGKDTFSTKVSFMMSAAAKAFVLIFALTLEQLQKTIFTNQAIYPVRSTYFTGCYVVTRGGAEKMLSLHNRIVYSADQLPAVTRKELGMKFVIYTPQIVFQKRSEFPSNIGPAQQ